MVSTGQEAPTIAPVNSTNDFPILQNESNIQCRVARRAQEKGVWQRETTVSCASIIFEKYFLAKRHRGV